MSKVITSIFDNIRSIIALSIVLLSFAFLFMLVLRAVPAENKEVVNIAAGLVLASLSGVAGYYFGSSKNESDKAKVDQINKLDQPTIETK